MSHAQKRLVACIDSKVLCVTPCCHSCVCHFRSSINCLQTVLWEDYALDAGVNAVQLQHDLEADDEERLPPTVQQLQIGSQLFDFFNHGWQDASLVLAAHQLRHLEIKLTLAFNDDDSTADQLIVHLQQRSGVRLIECYSSEAMQV